MEPSYSVYVEEMAFLFLAQSLMSIRAYYAGARGRAQALSVQAITVQASPQAKEDMQLIKDNNRPGGTPEAVLVMVSKRDDSTAEHIHVLHLKSGKIAMKKLQNKV